MLLRVRLRPCRAHTIWAWSAIVLVLSSSTMAPAEARHPLAHRRLQAEEQAAHQHHLHTHMIPSTGMSSYSQAAVHSISSRLPPAHDDSPSTSTFTCNGLKWEEHNRYGQPDARACKFDNLCFDAASQTFQYFHDNSSGPLFYDQSGKAHFDFPAKWVSTGHVHVPSNKYWAPEVLMQPFPQNATFHPAPVVAYASINDFVGNFGHALFDFLFPVFNVLQLMGAYTPDFQLVFAAQQGTSTRAGGAFITPEDSERSLLRLISTRKPVTRQQLAQESGNTGLTCFRSLVAGTGSLQLTMARTRALPFRAAAFMNMGLVNEPDLGASKPMITFLKKKGRRMVENTDDLVEGLQTKFPNAAVSIVDGDELSTMSMHRQLEVMSNTSVLITPCGGTGTVLTFLQPGATAIVMNFWQTERQSSEQMENIYYWNLEYLDLEYFPVLPEDYENTHDRPACEKVDDGTNTFKDQGKLINCNLHIKNAERLENVVGTALQKWAVAHNHTHSVRHHYSRRHSHF